MDPIVGAAGFGLLGAAGGIINNERNLAAQREAQEYNKWAQQQTWMREDNAVQRRVADLRAAGLSPVLAAGSSAQAGSPTKIDPTVSEDMLGTSKFISGVTAAAQTQQSIAAAAAAEQQVNLLKAQTLKTGTETAVLGKEFGLYSEVGGHPKYQDTWGKRLSEIIRGASDIFSKAKIGERVEKYKENYKREILKGQWPFRKED